MGRLLYHQEVMRLLYLTQDRGSRTNGWPIFLKRSLNHIIHCRMPLIAASTVFTGHAMQTQTVHPRPLHWQG